jgi:hypothetical protein
MRVELGCGCTVQDPKKPLYCSCASFLVAGSAHARMDEVPSRLLGWRRPFCAPLAAHRTDARLNTASIQMPHSLGLHRCTMQSVCCLVAVTSVQRYIAHGQPAHAQQLSTRDDHKAVPLQAASRVSSMSCPDYGMQMHLHAVAQLLRQVVGQQSGPCQTYPRHAMLKAFDYWKSDLQVSAA